MNVIGTRPDGWWKDRRRAMVRLVGQLEPWAAAQGDTVTVVFERPLSPPIRSAVIEIGHAPRAGANSADDEIVRLVRADDRPHEINVVTSDITLAERVRHAGASTSSAAAFRNLIEHVAVPARAPECEAVQQDNDKADGARGLHRESTVDQQRAHRGREGGQRAGT